MKTYKKPRELKRIAIITIAALLIAGLGICIFFLIKPQPTNNTNQPKTSESTDTQLINNGPPTTEQKSAGESQKEETNNSTPNNNLGISITSINVLNDPIQIRSVISGVISSSGSCTLSLTQGSTVVTKTSDTYALPDSSTCRGFDINKNELSSGEWGLELTVNINDKTSSITDSFTLE